jgi:magnesium transporter
MIEIYFKALREGTFERIKEPQAGCWISVKSATQKDLEQISKDCSLELADIRDSLDKYEISRLERQGDSLIFFTRHPGDQEPGLYTEPLTIILTPSYLISISPYSSKIVEQILTLNVNFTTTQRSQLLLYILLRITQEFTASIKRVLQVILIYKEPTGSVDSNAIIVLTKSEEILNQYLTSLVPLRNLMEMLSTDRYITLYEKDLDLLEDSMISIRQSEDLCRVNVKSIRSLRDSYQIIFTNDVNKTIKRLTALTILFSIPTMIASIYGMNIPIPYQTYAHAFPVVIGTAIFTCLLAILVFRRNRWL